MASTYSVAPNVIQCIRRSFEVSASACGYLFGFRTYCFAEKEEADCSNATIVNRSVSVLGAVKLPISFAQAIEIENSDNSDEYQEMSKVAKFYVTGVPAGMDIVGVFCSGDTETEWDEDTKADFANGMLSLVLGSLDDNDLDYLILSFTKSDIVALNYSKEEIAETKFQSMDKYSQSHWTFRLESNFSIQVDSDSSLGSVDLEIDRLVSQVRTNSEYEYYFPDVQAIFPRRVSTGHDNIEQDIAGSERLITRLGDTSSGRGSPDFTRVNLIKFHARAEREGLLVEVPSLAHERIEKERISIPLTIDCLFQVSKDVTVSEFVKSMDQTVLQQLLAHKYLTRKFYDSFNLCSFVPFHFTHDLNDHYLTCSYPIQSFTNGSISEKELVTYRKELHDAYLLSFDKPLLKKCLSLFSSLHLQRLVNPHSSVAKPNPTDAIMATVSGNYSYYHYMQDRIDDNGWGCAYRSFQTLCSWFIHQGYSHTTVPTHKEIQEALVSLGDKEKKLIGSKQWIGSFEVSLCLDYFVGIKSKILHVSSGSEMGSKGRELIKHFQEQGTPIMIGGGVLAHTILGLWLNESTGETKFLILDPHYTGADEIKTIVNKGWCGWKGCDFWDQLAHYNLCLPQKPLEL